MFAERIPPKLRLPPLIEESVKSTLPVTDAVAPPRFKTEPALPMIELAAKAPPVRFKGVAPEKLNAPAVTPAASTTKFPPEEKFASLPLTQGAETPPDCQFAAVPTAQAPDPPVHV